VAHALHHAEVMLRRRDALENLTVRAGTVDLRASLGVPPGPVGLAILADGSGDTRTSARERHVAEALRARGLATLLVDLLTEPERANDRLDPSRRFEVDVLAERLLGVVDWIVRESHVAHLPVAIDATGTAAAAALIAAAQRPDLVRVIVSRAGRPDLAGASLPSVAAPTLFLVGSADHDELELDRETIARMTVPTQLAIVPGRLGDEPSALDEAAQLSGEWIVEHLAHGLVEPHAEARPFRDRRSAGARLTELLPSYAADAIVFAASPGGAPVADEIAKVLGAPLDVWLVRKIGMPIQPELGMGALAEGAALVLDPSIVRWSGVSPDELRALVHRTAIAIRRRARAYRTDQPPLDLHGRAAILVEDGIATAGMLRAAVRGARRRGAARVIVAAPVAAAEATARLRLEADEVIALAVPPHLSSLRAWYHDCAPLNDRDVSSILDAARKRLEARGAA
jgi:predicted phosphoribosyltransferase